MPEKTESIPCNRCLNATRHKLLSTHEQSGSEPYDEESSTHWTKIYDLLECCGCQEITLRRVFYFSEWNPGDYETIYYPPRIGRTLPIWQKELPGEIASLLREVYMALQANSGRLAMMGARALIDMTILDQIGDAGSFKQKLDVLEEDGFISSKNREILEAALEVGNAASHRGYCPPDIHINQVVDIVENH